jgi:hypothetical protein
MGLYSRDLYYWNLYSRLMAENPPHLILTIETKDPIEVGAFVGQFTALASQYDKYIRATYPDVAETAEIYVAEVKEGSIVAHLIPYFMMAGGAGVAAWAAIEGMDKIMILEDFVTRYGGRIANYFKHGGRDKEASKCDLKDFHNAVAAIANDPNGAAKLETAVFEDGEKKIRAAFKFTTQDARIAEGEIASHRLEIEKSTSADHERVLMVFVRSDVRGADAGKRSGELVTIESIAPKPLPLIYASQLAEQRIKYEIRDEESVYRKGFVVDVNVELRRGKACAYRVTNLHQVIELPDDG